MLGEGPLLPIGERVDGDFVGFFEEREWVVEAPIEVIITLSFFICCEVYYLSIYNNEIIMRC